MGYKAFNFCNYTLASTLRAQKLQTFWGRKFCAAILYPSQFVLFQYLAPISCKVTKLHGFLTELSDSMQKKNSSCAVPPEQECVL